MAIKRITKLLNRLEILERIPAESLLDEHTYGYKTIIYKTYLFGIIRIKIAGYYKFYTRTTTISNQHKWRFFKTLK